MALPSLAPAAAILAVLFLTGVGCSRDEAESAPGLQEQASLSDDGTDAAPAAAIEATAFDMTATEPPLETFFSGKALEAARLESQPAPPEVIEAASAHIARVALVEKCARASRPRSTRLLDLDDDGHLESVSFFELAGCNDSAVIRIVTVARQDKDLAWQPVLTAALSVMANEHRPIIDMGGGSITIAGGRDGFGDMTDPEVIEIPPAAHPMLETADED